MEFYLYGIPPQNTLSKSNHEKNITQTSTEGQSTKYVTSTLQTQGNTYSQQTHGKSEEWSQPRIA